VDFSQKTPGTSITFIPSKNNTQEQQQTATMMRNIMYPNAGAAPQCVGPTCATCTQHIEYKQIKTSGNDPTITKRAQLVRNLRSRR
jgi:hypothetical protein